MFAPRLKRCLNQLTSVCCLLLLFAPSAWAELAPEITEGLAVTSAYLVAPVGKDWLIDVDTTQGVKAGDLFSVIDKGTPVIHPVSQQIIGTLKTVRAVLRVTKVKTGYSHAEVLQTKSELQAGLSIQRFAGLPAVFWDYTGQGEPLFTELRNASPHLEWQDYARSQLTRPEPARPLDQMEPGLVFVFNEYGLGIKDHAFQPLRFYPPEQLPLIVQARLAQTSPPPVASLPATPSAPAETGLLVAQSPLESAATRESATAPGHSAETRRGGLIVSPAQTREGIWYGPKMEGHPVGIEVGDLNGDGRNEVALLFVSRLEVGQIVAEDYQLLARLDFGAAEKALALDGVDLDANGRMELYVTMDRNNRASSQLIELQGQQLIQVKTDIPWLLRGLEMPGEGRILLGHVPNHESTSELTDFVGPVFRVARNGNDLVKGEPMDLPENVAPFGFLPSPQQGQTLFANLNVHDKLQLLDPAGAVVWQSHEEYGGSEISFTRSDGTQDGTRQVFLKARIEPGPDNTLLVPVNLGNRLSNAFRHFDSSHLRALHFDGYALTERWRTKPQGGYLADFRLADADNDGRDEIVMLVMFSKSGWIKSSYGGSALLIYEME